jgi:tripartite ATP-independent transporter DctM subunit
LDLLPFLILILFFALGVPIAFSLGVSGIVGILILTGDLKALLLMSGLITFNSVASYTLTTIPMFTLMAFLSASGGLATKLFEAASNWVSNIRGGLAIATVFSCGVFGAMSGVSTAAASVMSEIAVPNMRRLGYSDVLTGGVVSVGSTLDLLIPPSVFAVVYGFITGTSIGKMLLAGVIPGIILGIFLSFCIFIWVTVRPQDAPKTDGVSWSKRWRSLWGIWPSLMLIVMVMVLLYTGIATPTEVGALGAFMSGLIGFVTRRLNWTQTLEAIKGTIRASVMIFVIIIGAYIFGAFITQSGIPDKMIAVVTAMNLNRWVVIIAIVLTYFFFSMFMDEIPLMLIYLQLTFPLVIKLGFDPIWYGVVMGMMIMMGMVFPPVGIIAFIVSGVGKIPLIKVYKGTSILIIAIFMTLILLMIYPEIVLWLPSAMK